MIGLVQVPQRIIRDSDLSVISSLSAEENSYPHQENALERAPTQSSPYHGLPKEQPSLSPTSVSSGDTSNHLNKEIRDLIVFPQKQQLVSCSSPEELVGASREQAGRHCRYVVRDHHSKLLGY